MKNYSYLVIAAILFGASQTLCAPNSDAELFLTPLIKNGELEQARAQAEDNMKISNISIQCEKEIKSYSGYFTIDEKSNANLFFWFFPAQENPEKAPIILWINEIQGFSSVRGIFLETGPFKMWEENVIIERNESWTKSHSMLYIDSPVGTGFSFAANENAYANSSMEEADEVYEALHQFFTLFTDFQSVEFYVAGEHLAVFFIPHLVKRIETENERNELKINVKGFILGSPSIDPSQLWKGQVLQDFGLIDVKQKKVIEETVDMGVDMIRRGQNEEGTQVLVNVYMGPESLVAKFTGFKDNYNALVSKPPPEFGWFQNFIDSKEVHKYLHVGVHKYFGRNFRVLSRFAKELLTSHSEILEELLNKGYRVLVYAPQLSMYGPQRGVAREVSKLKWDGAEKFSKAPRKIWRVKDDVAGYVKMADNFVFAIVRNAGHYAIMDQPEWMNDLVETFLNKKDF